MHLFVSVVSGAVRPIASSLFISKMAQSVVYEKGVVTCIGEDLAPSLGGGEQISRNKFSNDFLSDKFPFLRRQFLMTLF